MKTIEQFGAQFVRFPTGHGSGFYGSPDHLMDTFGEMLPNIVGASVADIGSGPGRVVNMLLDLGAARVTAVEPSDAFYVLKENTSARAEQIEYVHGPGDKLPLLGFDYVFSVGVLHHIAEPLPVVRRAYEALKPGGRILIWLYAREGNEGYLALALPLRVVTTRLPDGMLVLLSRVLNVILAPYVWACRWLPIPRYRHFREVFGRMSSAQRTLVIFDQLNPTDAKYYTRDQAEALLRNGGFEDVCVQHRHGYSWTVSGIKPGN